MQSSSLQQRLARIAPGRHPASEAEATPELQALIQRVERLRLRARARPKSADDHSFAASLGARVLCPGVLVIERRYPRWHRHGRVPLQRLSTNMTPEHVVLDTETSGLAGGTGTIAFMVGMATAAEDGIVIRQYLLTGFGAERELLLQVSDALRPCSTLVSFNGKSFDVPLLGARYRLHELATPLARLEHHDMLHLLRKMHGGRLPNCRLQTAEAMLLGFSRRDDLPGSEVPQAWRRLVTLGDGSQIAAVLRHNRDDLLSLAALYWALSESTDAERAESEMRDGARADLSQFRLTQAPSRSPRSHTALPAAGPCEASGGSRQA